MSGQAGASIQSEYYQLNFTSGVYVSVAEPPWIEGEERNRDYTAEYFEQENKHFENILRKVKPALDEIFNRVFNNNDLPILKFDSEAQIVGGVIIEDTEDYESDSSNDQFIKDWIRGQEHPKIDLNWEFVTGQIEQIHLRVTVNERVLRSDINKLQAEILQLFT